MGPPVAVSVNDPLSDPLPPLMVTVVDEIDRVPSPPPADDDEDASGDMTGAGDVATGVATVPAVGAAPGVTVVPGVTATGAPDVAAEAGGVRPPGPDEGALGGSPPPAA